MNATRRTVLGTLLFVPLAAVILATIACLPVPVGDPEKSKVDAALSGAYQQVSTDPADKDKTTVVILAPWDAHTYLLQYATSDTSTTPPTGDVTNFKAWLTDLGGATFLTAQPMNSVPGMPTDPGDQPFWAVFRLDGAKAAGQGHPGKTADVITARMVNNESPLFKDLDKDHTTREAVEAIIKAHAGDDALYTDKGITFKKLGPADAAMIEKTLTAAHPTVAIQTQPASQPGSKTDSLP